LIQRYNSDLANDLGNLANRTITMLNRYLDGIIPNPLPQTLEIQRLLVVKSATFQKARTAFDNYDFSHGLDAIWLLVGSVNQWLAESQPWVLAGDSSRRTQLEAVLYVAARALRIAAVLSYPVLPHSARKLWKQLNQEGDVSEVRLDDSRWDELITGTRVGKPEPIFPRLDKVRTLAKLDELAEADRDRDKPKAATPQPPVPSPQPPVRYKPKEAFIPVQPEKKPETASTPAPGSPAPSPQPPAPSLISIEDFAKVDMRVGEVKSAELVPGASKLLKVMVDIGTEVRQLVAGLAEYYQPENLVGMKVVVVTNLQPRKLRGVESNGMIVAASVGDHGRPVLVTFKEDVANGARLK
jgi:methionyl-tRNA synthetase